MAFDARLVRQRAEAAPTAAAPLFSRTV
jgi:hypothetical protein